MAGGRIRTDGHLLLPKHPRVLPPSIYVCIIPHNILIVNKMIKKGPQNCGGLSISSCQPTRLPRARASCRFRRRCSYRTQDARRNSAERLALSLHKSAKRRVVLVCFFQLRSGPMCCTSFAFGYEVHHSGQDLPESGVTAFGLVLHGLEEVHNSFSLVQFIKRHFSVVDNSRVQYGVLIEDDDTMMGRNRISHE